MNTLISNASSKAKTTLLLSTLFGMTSLSACNLESLMGDTSESLIENSEKSGTQEKFATKGSLRSAPKLALHEQNQIRLIPTLKVRVLDSAGIITLGTPSESRAILRTADFAFNLASLIPVLEEVIRSAVPMLIAKNIAIYQTESSSPRVTLEVLELIRDTLASNGFGEDQIDLSSLERLTDILLDTLRDDFVEMNVMMSFDVHSAAMGHTDPMESISNYMGRYGIGVSADTRTVGGNEVTFFTYEYEAGDSHSGDWVAVDEHGYTVSGDHDKNDNGIPDYLNDDPDDSRGDGNGFLDALNDALYGDDGDGITPESEGRYLLQAQVDRAMQGYGVLSQSSLRKLFEQAGSSFISGDVIESTANVRIQTINKMLSAASAHSTNVSLQAVRLSRPVRR